MKDVQNERDERNVTLDRVGIKGLKYPITVLDRNFKEQPTVATINMMVELPKEYRGTHMSRFIEIINRYRWRIHINNIKDILKSMLEKLPSHSAYIEVEFPYFIKKSAPISKEESLMCYEVKVIATLREKEERFDRVLIVKVPIMTLCPCSKEISEKSAHNQRAFVTVEAELNDMVWIEEIIEIIESKASSSLYSLLKREDEKFVTEWAYEHPTFVEDVAREVYLALKEDRRIKNFKVEVESLESIHNHNAYAMVSSKR
ncbi:MAG: GTP cyclohydrolase FolE2 [Thermosulfidibacteraceae bacterium]|jgi:GTP cyclohydrolase I